MVLRVYEGCLMEAARPLAASGGPGHVLLIEDGPTRFPTL